MMVMPVSWWISPWGEQVALRLFCGLMVTFSFPLLIAASFVSECEENCALRRVNVSRPAGFLPCRLAAVEKNLPFKFLKCFGPVSFGCLLKSFLTLCFYFGTIADCGAVQVQRCWNGSCQPAWGCFAFPQNCGESAATSAIIFASQLFGSLLTRRLFVHFSGECVAQRQRWLWWPASSHVSSLPLAGDTLRRWDGTGL